LNVNNSIISYNVLRNLYYPFCNIDKSSVVVISGACFRIKSEI